MDPQIQTEERVNRISESELNDFLDFIASEKSYLENGLGVFHTDNHSNW
jgi:hypothetical protein